MKIRVVEGLESILSAFQNSLGSKEGGLLAGNMKARIRMVWQYTWAQEMGDCLVDFCSQLTYTCRA